MRSRAASSPRPTPRRTPRAGAVVVLGGVLGAASLAACGPSKAAQCSEVITRVNDATKRLEEGPTKSTADDDARVAHLRSMASGMAKVADDLSKMPTSAPELKDFSTRYQKLAREFARFGNEMAEGVEQNDVEKQNFAREQLDKISDDEGPLVASINDFCKGG